MQENKRKRNRRKGKNKRDKESKRKTRKRKKKRKKRKTQSCKKVKGEILRWRFFFSLENFIVGVFFFWKQF